jgi:hypothetical protein
MDVARWRKSIVSLSSPKSYTAVLGAHSVGLYRRLREGSELLGRAEFNAAQYPTWPAATDALAALLQAHAQAGGELRVLLSNHFTRVLLIPWVEQVTSPQELASYACICFEDIYAEPAAGWTLRLSPEAAGRARLAAALPDELLGRLQNQAKSVGWRLLSVQPYLMAAFNRFSTAVAQDDFLFIVAEPGRSSLLQARDGHWTSARAVSLANSDAALNALIARECALQRLDSAESATVYLHTPGRLEPFDSVAAQHLDRLWPLGQGDDLLHAMSLVVN